MKFPDEVWSAAFSPDGKYIVAASQNGQIDLIKFKL